MFCVTSKPFDKIWHRGVFFKLVMWDKYFAEKDWYLCVWFSPKNRPGVNYFEFQCIKLHSISLLQVPLLLLSCTKVIELQLLYIIELQLLYISNKLLYALQGKKIQTQFHLQLKFSVWR